MVHYCNLLGLSVSLTNRHGNWFFGQVNLYIVSLNNTFNRLKKISLTNRWGLPVYFFLSLHWPKWTFSWDFNPCFCSKHHFWACCPQHLNAFVKDIQNLVGLSLYSIANNKNARTEMCIAHDLFCSYFLKMLWLIGLKCFF